MKGDHSKYGSGETKYDSVHSDSFLDDSSMDDAQELNIELTKKETSESGGSFGKAGKDALAKRR
jgi:hypothetical protein